MSLDSHDVKCCSLSQIIVSDAVRAHTQASEGYMVKKCQRVLTVGFRVAGSVLELFEARICLESLAERPCTFWTDAVVPEAVNGAQISMSAGADSRKAMTSDVLERSEGLVLLQALREVLGGLSIEVI